jgi:small-conductance mechanosensitive channel
MDDLLAGLSSLADPAVLEWLGTQIHLWIAENVLIWGNIVQLLVIGAAFLAARFMAPAIGRSLERIGRRPKLEKGYQRLARVAALLSLPFAWLIIQWLSVLIAVQADVAHHLIQITVSLLTAWVVIRLASQLVRDPAWSRLIAATAWTIAALNILGLLDDATELLESMAFPIGDLRLSLLDLVKAAISLGILLWLAILLSSLFDRRVQTVTGFTPSVRSLLAKLFKIGLITIAVVAALGSVGIDLTAFAVLSGAIGVGIGFGLQSIFSNFVAGLIILLEKTLKVGDFVDLESGVTGEVREINIRSTVITTNDNIDILVPNSEFVNGRVTNWTLRDAYRRHRVPFGVAYGTDKELVRDAVLEAALAVEHTFVGQTNREPQVWLVGFGESSLDFELVVWLKPQAVNRPGRVHADYCWAIETALSKHKIEIPFPQRDIHVISPADLNVWIRRHEKAPDTSSVMAENSAEREKDGGPS